MKFVHALISIIFIMGCSDSSTLKKENIEFDKNSQDGWNICESANVNGTSAQRELAADKLRLPGSVSLVGVILDVDTQIFSGWKAYLVAPNGMWAVIQDLNKEQALSLSRGDVVKVTGTPNKCHVSGSKKFVIYLKPKHIMVSKGN